MTEGLAEEAKAEWGHKSETPISLSDKSFWKFYING